MDRKKPNVEKNDKEDKFYVQSLNRTFQIIDKISEARGRGISVTELSKSVDLHVSTVYRLLQNLVAWNYVVENANGNYILGLKLLQLGAIVQENIEIRNVARKYMEELNEATKETIYLSILDEEQKNIMYIEKMGSRRNVVLVAGVGSRNFIHSTANGKCLVSGFSDDKITQILKEKSMPGVTKNTITNIELFLREVQKVREFKYAIDDLENEETVRCVAAPIFDYRDTVVAAISISGLITDIDRDLLDTKYKDLVIKAAQQISGELGHRS